jgi:hypothetical protein
MILAHVPFNTCSHPTISLPKSPQGAWTATHSLPPPPFSLDALSSLAQIQVGIPSGKDSDDDGNVDSAEARGGGGLLLLVLLAVLLAVVLAALCGLLL